MEDANDNHCITLNKTEVITSIFQYFCESNVNWKGMTFIITIIHLCEKHVKDIMFLYFYILILCIYYLSGVG